MGLVESGDATGLDQVLVNADQTDQVTDWDIINGLDEATHHKVCTLTYANTVAFYDPFTKQKMKEFQTPTQTNSAHLKYFVAGDHDFNIVGTNYGLWRCIDNNK